MISTFFIAFSLLSRCVMAPYGNFRKSGDFDRGGGCGGGCGAGCGAGCGGGCGGGCGFRLFLKIRKITIPTVNIHTAIHINKIHVPFIYHNADNKMYQKNPIHFQHLYFTIASVLLKFSIHPIVHCTLL